MLNKFRPKSEFSRNVLTLMTGTTIAQAIPIAIAPILTRLYTPEDFGVFALYMSVASLLGVAATGRYELAIMLPKKDEDAVNIVMISLILSTFVSFISLIIVYIFNAQITHVLGNPEISNWLYAIPLSVLFTGIYQSCNYWNNRKKQYKRLAMYKVIQSGTSATTTLGAGIAAIGNSGLIIGVLMGQGVAATVIGGIVWKESHAMLKHIRKLKIFALLKKYHKFPTLNLPNAFIDHVRFAGINVLIARLFTTSALGQFSLAWKMVQTPMSLMGSSLSQVFFQKISVAKKRDLHVMVKAFLFKAFFVSLPFFLIIYFFAVDIFIFVFGSNWEVAGQAASVMSPWLFFNFLSAPMATVFMVLNRQEIILITSIFYMIVPISILLFTAHCGFIDALASITFAICFILFIFICLALLYTKEAHHVAN